MGNILDHVGDKWAVLLIVLLRQGPRRFSELEREVGTVSKKMLTPTLRYLERDGFISRKVTPSTPPRVDYALTALGEEVMGPRNFWRNGPWTTDSALLTHVLLMTRSSGRSYGIDRTGVRR